MWLNTSWDTIPRLRGGRWKYCDLPPDACTTCKKKKARPAQPKVGIYQLQNTGVVYPRALKFRYNDKERAVHAKRSEKN